MRILVSSSRIIEESLPREGGEELVGSISKCSLSLFYQYFMLHSCQKLKENCQKDIVVSISFYVTTFWAMLLSEFTLSGPRGIRLEKGKIQGLSILLITVILLYCIIKGPSLTHALCIPLLWLSSLNFCQK